MSSLVRFEEIVPTKGKTKKWLVKNYHSDFQIGVVKWYKGWAKYCFYPAPNCVFDPHALKFIRQFLLDAENLAGLPKEEASGISQ